MRPTAFTMVSLVLLAISLETHAATDQDAIEAAILAEDYATALSLIDTGLLESPNNTALRFQRARVLRFNGEQDAARQALDALRQDYPNNVDYALARAQLLASRGEDTQALQDLREASELAPNYEAVWRLRYALLQRQADNSLAPELAAVSATVKQRFPNSRWWRAPTTPADYRWTVILGAGHDTLDNDAPSWNNQFAKIIFEPDEQYRYRLGLTRNDRFRNTDSALSFGGDIRFGERWTAGLDVSVVGGAAFQPDAGYSAFLLKELDDGWVTTLRLGRREFETTSVNMLSGLIEKYVGAYRFAYNLSMSRLQGASTSFGHGLTANWYYSDLGSVGLSFNTGEEAESIGPGRVLETSVRGFSINARRQLSERFELSGWLGTHKQGDFYRRQYVGLALNVRL